MSAKAHFIRRQDSTAADWQVFARAFMPMLQRVMAQPRSSIYLKEAAQ